MQAIKTALWPVGLNYRPSLLTLWRIPLTKKTKPHRAREAMAPCDTTIRKGSGWVASWTRCPAKRALTTATYQVMPPNLSTASNSVSECRRSIPPSLSLTASIRTIKRYQKLLDTCIPQECSGNLQGLLLYGARGCFFLMNVPHLNIVEWCLYWSWIWTVLLDTGRRMSMFWGRVSLIVSLPSHTISD